jgi:Family of unknown function (DUF6325)
MTLCPLRRLVIGFNEDRFDGSIAKEIEKIVSAGVIRIVDIVYVTKTGEGTTAIVEIDNKNDPAFASFKRLLGKTQALFTNEDLERLADLMPPASAGLVLLFEHRWAEDIKEAMAKRGGFLVARSVIPPEVLEDLSAELEGREAVAAG